MRRYSSSGSGDPVSTTTGDRGALARSAPAPPARPCVGISRSSTTRAWLSPPIRSSASSPVPYLLHLEPVLLEDGPHQQPVLRVVIHHQDRRAPAPPGPGHLAQRERCVERPARPAAGRRPGPPRRRDRLLGSSTELERSGPRIRPSPGSGSRAPTHSRAVRSSSGDLRARVPRSASGTAYQRRRTAPRRPGGLFQRAPPAPALRPAVPAARAALPGFRARFPPLSGAPVPPGPPWPRPSGAADRLFGGVSASRPRTRSSSSRVVSPLRTRSIPTC
jgi:hypothetical protein